ncbi:helix-turn-helix domain-containing protein [Jannaschia sp. R86511]|uniref:helix-turn-helix domain-containing protein n=1 Tax=Jannaschia sp. R86511 TaxID=3093853 RepID=UPI0036D23B7A
MPSWTNATPTDPTTRGVLRPVTTGREAGLRRDLPVSPALEPFVERYWAVRWDRSGRGPFRSEVLPHPSVNLSLERGDRPRFGVELPAVLLHGVVGHRFTVDLTGRGRVVAAKFRPGGFTALTGVVVPRSTVRPVAPADLGEQGGQAAASGLDDALRVLSEDGSDEAVTARLDDALRPLAHEPDPAYRRLRDLLAAMVTDRALVRVEQVAELAGMSTRGLQRTFAAYVGLGPKAVLARYRLQDAVAAMDDGRVDDLAGLAASLGWFDQAHFSRDFRDVVGVTPTAYLADARARTTDAVDRPRSTPGP